MFIFSAATIKFLQSLTQIKPALKNKENNKMLDKLIESKNCGNENARRGGFLLTAFMAVSSILSFALIYSLFSYNLAWAAKS